MLTNIFECKHCGKHKIKNIFPIKLKALVDRVCLYTCPMCGYTATIYEDFNVYILMKDNQHLIRQRYGS